MTLPALRVATALATPRARALVALASVLSSAGLVALCVWLTDAAAVAQRLEAADPSWLLAFFAVYVLQLALLGLRWAVIARQLGVPLRWRRASAEYALSVVVNNVLPGGFAGDGYRAVRHARRCPEQPFARIVEALALDRLSGQLALVLLVVASAPLTIRAGLLEARWVAVSVLGLATTGIAAALWGRRTPAAHRLLAGLQRFAAQATSLLFAPRRAAAHLPISLLLTSTLILQLWLAARAAGIALDLSVLCWLGPLLVLAGSAPSFFASWGVREGASAVLFATAGLPSSAGVAVSLLFGAYALVCALPGAAVLWLDAHPTARRPLARAQLPSDLAPFRGSAAPLGARSDSGAELRRVESASTNDTSGVDSAST